MAINPKIQTLKQKVSSLTKRQFRDIVLLLETEIDLEKDTIIEILLRPDKSKILKSEPHLIDIFIDILSNPNKQSKEYQLVNFDKIAREKMELREEIQSLKAILQEKEEEIKTLQQKIKSNCLSVNVKAKPLRSPKSKRQHRLEFLKGYRLSQADVEYISKLKVLYIGNSNNDRSKFNLRWKSINNRSEFIFVHEIDGGFISKEIQKGDFDIIILTPCRRHSINEQLGSLIRHAKLLDRANTIKKLNYDKNLIFEILRRRNEI